MSAEYFTISCPSAPVYADADKGSHETPSPQVGRIEHNTIVAGVIEIGVARQRSIEARYLRLKYPPEWDGRGYIWMGHLAAYNMADPFARRQPRKRRFR